MASALSQQPNEIVVPVWEPTNERRSAMPYLPYDIWADIIAVLADDKQTLSQLALVSRGLYGFVVPTLYQRIDLEVPFRRKQAREPRQRPTEWLGNWLHLRDQIRRGRRLQLCFRDGADPTAGPAPDAAASLKILPSWSPFCQFIRTVKNSPGLGGLVQTVKLTRRCTDEDIDDAVNLLLEKLPHVRKLIFDAHWNNDDYEAEFLKQNPMPLLRQVKLIRVSGESKLRDTLLQKRQIENLAVQGRLLRTMMPDDTAHMSFLLTLKVLYQSPVDLIEEGDLERALAWPQALERLHCHVPYVNYWPPGSTSHPAILRQSLQPVAHSLKELKLDCHHWPAVASGRHRLDLSDGFPCLRVLQVPACCLFATERLDVTRNGAYELLPPTVQELHVLFTARWGVFYLGGKAGAIYRESRRMEGEDPATYQWLTELARYKPSNFSCLKRVEVTEEGGKGTWIASKTVKALFDSAGVALDVRLRGRKSKPRRVKDSRADPRDKASTLAQAPAVLDGGGSASDGEGVLGAS